MTINANVPVRQYPVIREHMTPSPHTIARTRSLAAARQTMRDHNVRHLPVLDGGRIVGIVSERDLLMIESIPGVHPIDVAVEEAMVQDVFTASPDTPIGEVIETMIERNLGSAIVSEGDRVIGVFTTIGDRSVSLTAIGRKGPQTGAPPLPVAGPGGRDRRKRCHRRRPRVMRSRVTNCRKASRATSQAAAT
jgi:acetoin utilization protein AcuB